MYNPRYDLELTSTKALRQKSSANAVSGNTKSSCRGFPTDSRPPSVAFERLSSHVSSELCIAARRLRRQRRARRASTCTFIRKVDGAHVTLETIRQVELSLDDGGSDADVRGKLGMSLSRCVVVICSLSFVRTEIIY
ncbi:uncharacterized protein V6R79_012140 [Siganus canaliculatus]